MYKIIVFTHACTTYPPTSLSVERVRTRHQPASPSATNLTPLNSLRSSAIQPASTLNLVAGSLQVRWLVVCRSLARILIVIGFGLGRESDATGRHIDATGRHRLPDILVLKHPKIHENLPRPA